MSGTAPPDHRTTLAVFAGAGVLFGGLLAAVGIAIALGLVRPGPIVDLTPWLWTEIVGGALVALLAGRCSRRIGGGVRAPLILAAGALVLGAAEAAELMRNLGTAAVANRELILIAPLVIPAGLLAGGWTRGARDVRRLQATQSGTGWRVIVPLAILTAAAAVARFGLPHHPDSDLLAAAVTIDFTLIVPGATYCLLVRSRRGPLVVVVAAFLVGCTVASLTIPIDRQNALDIVKFGIIPAEAAVLLFLLTATRRALRNERRDDAHDFATRLRRTARAVTGSRLAAGVLTTEFGVLRHALTRERAATTGYTVHRRNGYGSIVAGVMMAMVPETAAVHLLLSRWSPTAAWIVTALGVYTALWLLGDYRALAARRLELTPRALRFRYGLRWEARIPRRRIAGAELVSQKPKATPTILSASVWGPPNLRLLLHKPTVVHGLYGMRRKVTEIHVRVDEPEALRAALLA